jgi:hypothetical protein
VDAKQPNVMVFFWDKLGWGEVDHQFDTSLVKSHDELADPHHGLEHQTG